MMTSTGKQWSERNTREAERSMFFTPLMGGDTRQAPKPAPSGIDDVLARSRQAGTDWDRRMLCVIHAQSYGAPGVCDCSACQEFGRGGK